MGQLYDDDILFIDIYILNVAAFILSTSCRKRHFMEMARIGGPPGPLVDPEIIKDYCINNTYFLNILFFYTLIFIRPTRDSHACTLQENTLRYLSTETVARKDADGHCLR